jgi:hypothetical protein
MLSKNDRKFKSQDIFQLPVPLRTSGEQHELITNELLDISIDDSMDQFGTFCVLLPAADGPRWSSRVFRVAAAG